MKSDLISFQITFPWSERLVARFKKSAAYVAKENERCERAQAQIEKSKEELRRKLLENGIFLGI